MKLLKQHGLFSMHVRICLKYSCKILQCQNTFESDKNMTFLGYCVVPPSFSITLNILQVEQCFFKVEFCVEDKILQNLKRYF